MSGIARSPFEINCPLLIQRILKYGNKKFLPGNYRFHPDWIILGVNNTCNLHCKMCDVGTQSLETTFATNLIGTQPLNMPLELYTKIIDQTAEHFPKAKIGFAFTEPLAYPYLIEAVAYAHGKNLFTSVTTNGLLLPNKAEKLVGAGLDELFISLDGLEPTHNEIRGNEKSFQKAVEGIEKVLRCPNPPSVSIACVITEWNVSELEMFADYLQRFPIKNLHFLHSVYATNEQAYQHNQLWGHLYPATESNVDESDLSKFDLTKLMEQLQKIKKRNFPFTITFSPELNSLEALSTYYHNPSVFIGKSCEDVYSMMMFKSDGSVIPAHGRCYNLTVGNLYQHSIKEIWNSSVFGKFRQDLRNSGGFLPACSRCCSALS